ncbi:hypothetical protein [Gaetbulibacter aestuarii]|uniref:CHAD domain-containing protein n=1 Tax=Gaetbulibacter aestuarii TaxID=1502358 RepID=A0ABW7MZM2_9FLAO
MKAASIRDIKKELTTLTAQELQDLCLRLGRFKKENKELLSYLLFESFDEDAYVESIKGYMDESFETINTASFFYIRKSVRKILKNVKKFIRYSQKKETEVDLLLYFCEKLRDFKPSIQRSSQLRNSYNRQLLLAKKVLKGLHEDLQFEFEEKLEYLKPL